MYQMYQVDLSVTSGLRKISGIDSVATSQFQEDGITYHPYSGNIG
jgi:hypothetical protein